MSKTDSFRRRRQATVLVTEELRDAAIAQCGSVQRLTELELELRISESRSDRKHRSDVLDWLKPICYLLLLMTFVVLLRAPLPAWATVICAALMLNTFRVLVCTRR